MFCANCGKPIKDGDLFCGNCGTRIVTYPKEPPLTPEKAAEVTAHSVLDEEAVTPMTTSGFTGSPYDVNDTSALPQAASPYEVPVHSVTATGIPSNQPYQSRAVELPHSGVVNAYPPQSVQYAEPKSRSRLVGGIVGGTAFFVIAALVVMFIKPGFLRNNDVPLQNGGDISSVHLSDVDTYNTDTDGSDSLPEIIPSKSTYSSEIDSDTVSSKVTSSELTSSKRNVSSRSASSKAVSSGSVFPKSDESKSEPSNTASSGAYSLTESVGSKNEIVSQYTPEPEQQTDTRHENETVESESEDPFENEINEDSLAYGEAMLYSTDERPKFEEFDWCFGQNGLIYTPPSGADMIKNEMGTVGGWKCMVIYNPSNIAGTFIRELNNVTIYVYDGDADVRVDWYLMSVDAQSGADNEEDMEDTIYHGSSMNGSISVTSDETDSSIVVQNFWKENGHEYALGTLYTADGLPAYFALIR